MRKLKRDLNSSASDKHFDQVIADGYDVFVERNRDRIEERLDIERQSRENQQGFKEVLKEAKRLSKK
jgi:hypothetical protein